MTENMNDKTPALEPGSLWYGFGFLTAWAVVTCLVAGILVLTTPLGWYAALLPAIILTGLQTLFSLVTKREP